MKPLHDNQPKSTLINQPIVESPYSTGNRSLKKKMTLDLSAPRRHMVVNPNYEMVASSPYYNPAAVSSPVDRRSVVLQTQKSSNSASLDEESPLISEISNLTAFTEIVSCSFTLGILIRCSF